LFSEISGKRYLRIKRLEIQCIKNIMNVVSDYRAQFLKYFKRIEEFHTQNPVLKYDPRRMQNLFRSVISGMIKEKFNGD
jgi:hypothetical protein